MSTPQEKWEQWFQDTWAFREDTVYKRIFGQVGPHVHTIPPELFLRLGQPKPDNRWLVHGVFEIPPSDKLPYWSYLTTALSNPWGIDPAVVKQDEPSGLGIELVMHTPVQSNWAIQVLHWLMAVNILAGSGILQGEVVSAGGRVPLHTSIDPQQPESIIRNLLIVESNHLEPRFTLPSGTVDLLLCLGVSDSEMQMAESLDYDETIVRLERAGVYPVTDPKRSAISAN